MQGDPWHWERWISRHLLPRVAAVRAVTSRPATHPEPREDT